MKLKASVHGVKKNPSKSAGLKGKINPNYVVKYKLMQTTIKSAKNHVLGSALLLLYLLIAEKNKKQKHVGLTSCFGFFWYQENWPLHVWLTHTLRCWSECMSEFCSRWHWNIVRTFPVLCLEPRHSLHCSYLMLINSQAKMSSVCVCVFACDWFHMVSASDAPGRWGKRLNRRVTCGQVPSDGVCGSDVGSAQECSGDW